MIVVDYINRYGDHILFTEQEDGSIFMSGGSYWRCGWSGVYLEDETVFNMVDPAGGPYIGLGDDMGMFSRDWKDKSIKKIEMVEGGAVFSF